MTEINSYANDLLIDFLDAFHDRIHSVLKAEFGETWFAQGVERHLGGKALERAREMLNSPMRVVDMNKSDDELYGVEHIWNIVNGNWRLFDPRFQDKRRTEVYLQEIAELRHNVSHRRSHHLLRRRDLARFVYNAQLLLRAIDSSDSARFEAIGTSLEQGSTPWGAALGGTLPTPQEIVPNFVGRDPQIRELSIWLTAPRPSPIVIWGYGGSGKSALAYHFAQSVREGAPDDLQAVVWLSAKVREFIAGEARDRRADFHDIPSFGSSLWHSLYGDSPPDDQINPSNIIDELNVTPTLIIVDDLDTILDNQELANFLLFELPRTSSKIVFTSRQRIPGLQTLEVEGFDEQELDSFIRARAREYQLDVAECIDRLPGIKSVTDGFPLFVDDLLRHALLFSLKTAMEDWSQRKGDAAREYALRRQLESLGETARKALITVSVANRPVSSLEVGDIAGYTDDDVQQALNDLLAWRLLARSEVNAAGQPTFSCNRNTDRLVQKTYGQDPLYKSYYASFRSLAGSEMPAAMKRAVGGAIADANALVRRADYEAARDSLREAMSGELANSADLWGALGWVWSRTRSLEATIEARTAFQRSHSLGSRKEDTYFHWVQLERIVADELISGGDDDALLRQWRVAFQVVTEGIRRCGETTSLCQIAAYLKTREGKTLERMNQFTPARTCFLEAVEWARKALELPRSTSREIARSQLHRTLVVALGGCGDHQKTAEAMNEWKREQGDRDFDYQREREWLSGTPEVLALLR